MRQIYPMAGDGIPTINKLDSFHFTEDQYNSILAALDALRTAQTADENALEDFKSALRNEVQTALVNTAHLNVASAANIAEATINTLSASGITSSSISTSTLTATISATIKRVIAETLKADSAEIDDISAKTITADTKVEAPVVNATTVNTTNLNADNYSIETGSITNLSSDNATITNATINNATVNEATISDATVTELKATEATITDNYSRIIYNHYFNHNKIFNRQVIDSSSVSADGDCWIVLPKFKNGIYYLIAKNGENGPFLWSLEIENSIKNICFRWSNNSDEVQYLKDVDFINDEYGHQFIQIHFNTNGLSTHIWHQCTDYETQTPPSYYAVRQYSDDSVFKHFDITRNDGVYLPNAVFAGDFHADSIEIDDVHFDEVYVNKSIMLPNAYDQYGEPLGYSRGLPGQYITNLENDDNFDELVWQEPVDKRTPSSVDETRTLITEATLGNYTGEMTAEKIVETVASIDDVATDGTQYIKVEREYFPIVDKQTIPAYRDEYSIDALTQEEAEQLIGAGLYLFEDPDYVQITSINVEDKLINGTDYSADWATLKAYSEEHPADYQVEYDGAFHSVVFPLDVYVNNGVEYNILHTGDGTIIHGDGTVNNDLEIKRDLKVDRNANIVKNTTIGGNLTVADEYVNPDDPTDRQNNTVEIPNVTVRDYIKNKHLFIGKGTDKPNDLEDDSLVIAEGATTTQTLIYTDGTNFYEENTTATTQPSGTAGTPTVIGNFVLDGAIWYQKVTDTWYSVNDFIDNTGWTVVSDAELIAILDAATPVEISEVVYTETTYGDAQLTRQTTIDNVTKIDEIAVRNSDYDDWVHAAHKPLVYNMPRRAIEPTDEISIEDLKADTVITNDLYVNRKAYINYQVEQEVEGNYLTLRTNNNAGMTSGEYSGFLVNNYQAGKICAVVIDNEGMVRVGNATGSSVTYPDLYYKLSDDKYYTDIEDPSTEVNPTGVLLAWDEVETTPTYKYWKNAVWKALTFTSTEPLLTRDEVLDMTDAALIRWDATGKKAKTIPLPTVNGQKLVGTIIVDNTDPLNPVTTYGYDWADLEPGTFIFDTVEDYEAALLIPEGQTGYIPNKSHIIIRGNYDTVLGV